MVADVQLGSPHTPTLVVTDANNSPVTTGVTGSMSVYGPASATAVIAGPTALTHYGDGEWGITVAGSLHATAGQYRYTVPSLAFASTTLVDQGGDYTVGLIPPQYRTLRAIMVAVCQALDCGLTGQATTNGTTTTLIDARWLDPGLASNEFVDDEILILEPIVGDANPVRVSAFAPGSGTFTLAKAISAGATASGQDYLLIRAGRSGLRYARIKEAIDAAIADLARTQVVTDEVTLTTASTTQRYSIPTNWLDVDRVEINQIRGGAGQEYWETFPPADYEVWPDRRLLVMRRWLGQGYALRLTGTVSIGEPRALGALVRVPWTLVRDWAVGYLGLPQAQRSGLLIQQSKAAASRLSTRG